MQTRSKSIFNIFALFALLASLLGSAVMVTPAYASIGTDLSINDVSQSEGDAGTTTFTFTVSLSSPAPVGGVTFDIATADNNATQPSDYTQNSLTSQTIPSGNSTYTFDVLVNGDTTFESNETFFVNVTNVTNATVMDSQGQGTITNDDPTQSGPNFVVNTTADTNDGVCDLLGQGSYNQDCTLREAINAANTISGVDTITFAADYTITLVGSQLPSITSTITIAGIGPSAEDTIVQASLCDPINLPGGCAPTINRVFQVSSSGNLTLDTLTVRYGYCDGTCPSDFLGGVGGGILNGGALTIMNSAILNNKTDFSAGGIYSLGSSSVTVIGSTISNNSTSSQGGGMWVANATVTNSTVVGNTAFYGGGIFKQPTGWLTITNSTISGNDIRNNGSNVSIANSIVNSGSCNGSAFTDGGNNLDSGNTCGFTTNALINTNPMLGALADNGGPTQTMALSAGSSAIDAGDDAVCAAAPVSSLDQRGVARPAVNCDIGAFESNMQAAPNLVVNTDEDSDDGYCDSLVSNITDCTLREAINLANNVSGADTITFADNYTITLGSQLPQVTTEIIINGNGAANTIIQANASPNTATYRVFEVGGTGSLTLNDLTVRNGRCNGSCATNTDVGGGIYNAGTLTVTNSTLSGNSAVFYGGGIYNNGTLTVTNSTLSGNSATFYGGGIYNDGTSTVTNSTLSGNSAGYGGGIFSFGTSTVTNSTLSGNSASYGGGIFNDGTSTVTNSTLSGNSASIYGGGIYNNGTSTLTNSTLSGNSASNGGGIYNNIGTLNYANTIVANSTSGDDCGNGATIGTNTNNLVQDGSCSAGFSGDPLLGALADNGGPTQTFALLTGSPAIDAGDDAVCDNNPGPNNLDQRGVTRPFGAHCDIGSFELNEGSLTFTSTGVYDGWVLESTETSNMGGTKNSTANVIKIGDDAQNRQFKGILHFDTTSLPDDATITSITLKLKKQGITGINPFSTHGNLLVRIRSGSFGQYNALRISDFQTPFSLKDAGLFSKTPISGWYSAILNSAAYPYLNLIGTTQFRVRFRKDDNNDFGADFMKFYSGNAGAANRPQLVIEYIVP